MMLRADALRPGRRRARRGRPARAAWRRRRARAEREGERGGRDADRDHDDAAQQQQAGEGETAEDVHGVRPFLGRDGLRCVSVAPQLLRRDALEARLSAAAQADAGRGEAAAAFRRASRYVPARMVIAFVLFWVLLGLGVFFVAMRGGPRGARESLHTESKARPARW